jgi:iron complex outermembrane recepter protein
MTHAFGNFDSLLSMGHLSVAECLRQAATNSNWGIDVANYARKDNQLFLTVSGAAILIGLLGTPSGARAEAAAADTAEPEIIIVTARRLEENLQAVPLTIRVLKETDIEREGVRNLSDVARLSAGITYDIGAFPNDTRPAVRGMQSERGRPSVAIMLDGQDLSGENLSIAGGTAGVASDLFDLERIEVVKGPQSTLYGRNAFAGAINYITKKPSFTPETRFGIELASGGQIGATGSLTGPLIDDKLAFRINAAVRNTDGFWTNPVNGGPLGAQSSQGGAIALRFTPTADLTVNLRYQTNEMDASDYPTAYVPANVRRPVPGGTFTAGPPGTPPTLCPASLVGLPASIVTSCTRGALVDTIKASIADVQMGRNEQTGAPPAGMEMTQDVGLFDVRWVSGFGTFNYSFGYLKNQTLIEQDGDFTNFAAAPGLVLSLSALNVLDYKNDHTDHGFYWTHKLGPLQVIVGGQVFSEDSTLLNDSKFWLRNPASPLAGPPFFLSNRQVTNLYPELIERQTEYTAFYGQVKWAVTDKLNIGLEARHNSDEITYTIPGYRLQDTSLSLLIPRCIPGLAQGAVFQGVFGPNVPPPGVVNACPRTEVLKYQETTPRFTVDYQLTKDMLLYASTAKGYKPGGFNTNEVTELLGQGYLPEFVTAYEIGIKSQWLDRRLTLNGDIYFNDYTDQQIGVQRNNVGAAGSIVATAGIINAGQVESKGFELDGDFQVNDRLSITMGYAYTDAVFKEYIGGPRPGSGIADFVACGVPNGQTSSDQTRADAGNACADFSGKRVAKSPKHSLNASALYSAPLGGSDNSWFVELSAQYRSERFIDESNLATMPAYTNVEFEAGLELGKVKWIAYVNNLTDDDTIRVSQRNVDAGRPEGFAPGRAYTAYLPTPRVVGIRMSLKVN